MPRGLQVLMLFSYVSDYPDTMEGRNRIARRLEG